MRKAKDTYSSWSDDEIDRWLEYHSTTKGHLDLGKIGPISAVPDVLFLIAVTVLLLMNFGIFTFADGLEIEGSATHVGLHVVMSIAFLFFVIILGFLAVGERVTTIRQYSQLKRVREDRAHAAFAS